ncbi:MAG: amino acid ABC transporter ATP-binding protein [Bacilli bacterium]|nr:amino acid ABC transporter ATP-binding protein [Bacilli bacterium]
MIEIKHLSRKYENVTPLKDINLTINKGDVISIIGPSGTGKSTLLRCINLLERPSTGEILFEGKNILAEDYDICSYRKKIGMVFQSFNLFNHLTVIENVMKPQIDLLKRTRQEAYDKAAALLKQVGLFEKKFSYPDELSGGQKQRIAIARTLAMDPELILFDEPTSALDPSLAIEVLEVIASIAKKGTSMMIVTHEMAFARDVSTRVVYLDEGVVYEEGTSRDIFVHPKKLKTKQFIFHTQIWDQTISTKSYDHAAMSQSLFTFLHSHYQDEHKIGIVLQLLEKAAKEVFDDFKDNDKFSIHLTIEIGRSKNQISFSLVYVGPIKTDYKKLLKKYTMEGASIIKFTESGKQNNYRTTFKLLIK